MTHRIYRTLAWMLTLTLCLAAPRTAAAQETQPHTDHPMNFQVVSQRDDRVIVRLPNRMLVAAQRIDTAPVVSVQVWVKTGSIYEQEHVGAGLSHFLEHLLSGGSTSTRSEAESNALLGRMGAKTNAATGLDTVRYYIDTTSDHTETAVDLMSDWMLNSLISEAEYNREREVIQREFEHGQGSPGRIFWKLTQQARYAAHPARHPTIGYLDEFLAVTRDGIYDFYKRMYVPNNMLFVVAGDIDPDKVVNQIASLWSDVPAGKLPDLKLPEEPIVEQPSEMSGFAAINQPKLRLAWPGTSLQEKHDYALDVLAIILGQGESSRLVQSVRDEQQLVTSISAFNLSFDWGRGFFSVDADLMVPQAEEGDSPKDAVQAAVVRTRQAILKQLQEIRTNGITEAELDRAKRKVLAGAISSTQSAHGFASRLASDVINTGDPDYLDYYAKAIQDMTRGQVIAAAVEVLKPSRMITITLLPAPPDHKNETLKRPDDTVDIDTLETKPVNLDNVVLFDRINRVQSQRADEPREVVIEPIQRFVLPNGLRLLVQRSTLVPAVAIQMYSLGGLLSDEAGREGVAAAVADMQMKGTESRTADEIAQQLEDLGASMDTAAGNNTTYVRANCLAEDWKTVLALAADVAIHPSFPEDEWARLQPRRVAQIARLKDSWYQELSQTFRPAFFGEEHPWSQATIGRAEVVESLTVENLRAFHTAHLGASQTVLAVFGDVDPDEVAKTAEQLFRDMPAEPAVAFDPPLPPAPESRTVTTGTPKPMAAVQVGFGPGATRRSPDYPALSVLAKVISDFPSGWLEGELRGSAGRGLAYAVWCYQFAGVVPGFFAVGYNTSPTQVDEAMQRTMSVIDRARDTTVDEETLQRAKAAVLVGEFLQKQTNSDRAAEAALNELYGLDLNEPERFLEEVQNLTPEVLQIAARLYLQNPVTVVLKDQSTLPVETE